MSALVSMLEGIIGILYGISAGRARDPDGPESDDAASGIRRVLDAVEQALAGSDVHRLAPDALGVGDAVLIGEVLAEEGVGTRPAGDYKEVHVERVVESGMDILHIATTAQDGRTANFRVLPGSQCGFAITSERGSELELLTDALDLQIRDLGRTLIADSDG